MSDVSRCKNGSDGRPADPTGGQLLELAELSADLIATFDGEDRLTWANSVYRKIYCCDPADRPFWQDIMRANYENKRGPVINTDNFDLWLTDAVARRAKKPYRCFEAEIHGGRWLWVTETVSADGLMLLYASDITSVKGGTRLLRNERDVARRASWTDPLTGVPNRRFLIENLTDWLSVQNSYPTFGDHSLAVLDLDHFKRVNDLHGHDFGDKVLISFCRDVVSHIRTLDFFGRIGGEEFLLFMPNCPVSRGRARLDALQDVVATGSLGADPSTARCTFSAGIVGVGAGEVLHDAIRRADRLLYQAKADGRACVRG